jgi:2-oxoglutarate dehydrogenase E1 component
MPHGMDGQGPEHSSGRIERFLSLTDQSLEALDLDKPVKKQVLLSNMQVIVPSFAANYFHALRRQMRRDYRKPLVSFNSKKLLRFKKACSVIAELDNKRFLTCLPETQSEKLVPVDKVRKVLICAGQVYYDLEEARDVAKVNDVAIVRVEQLAPFPFDHFKKVVAPYKYARF